jgi:hypothetical protein
VILDGNARAMKLRLDVLRAGPASGTYELSDGSTGWAMKRIDDCQQAALATLLQVPLSEVPDAHIDKRLAAGESVEKVDKTAWNQMITWLGGRGLRLVRHATTPTHLERWIGVVPNERPFQSHCLIMVRDRILFDPSVRPGVRTFYSVEIQYGLSIERVV